MARREDVLKVAAWLALTAMLVMYYQRGPAFLVWPDSDGYLK